MQNPTENSRQDIWEIQTALRQWIDLGQFHDPRPVTLTMKQALPTGRYGQRTYLTPEAASQNVRHFHNVLSKSVLGPRPYRQGERLPMIGVLEHGDDKRLHYHAIIDCVKPEMRSLFTILIVETWQATRWGYAQIHFGDEAGDLWLRYLAKRRDKPDFMACLDVDNWWLPNT
jgi:hypothetical protein